MTDQPNYTRLPNAIIEAMPTLGNAELRVLLAIARKTIGYQKHSDRISLSQIEAMTGLTHRNAHAALHALIAKGMVVQEQIGKQSFIYSIEPVPVGNQLAPKPVPVGNQYHEGTSTRREPEPVPVGNQLAPKPVPVGNTQKKDLKEKRKESERVQSHTPRPPTPIPKRTAQASLSFAHEGVTAYREIAEVRSLEAVKADTIAATVIDVPAWRDVVRAWITAGHRKDNVTGMLDWYLHPERMARSQSRGGVHGSNARPIRQGAQPARERAIWTEASIDDVV